MSMRPNLVEGLITMSERDPLHQELDDLRAENERLRAVNTIYRKALEQIAEKAIIQGMSPAMFASALLRRGQQ